MKKLLLAALMSLGMMASALAQSSFTATDSTGATQTFKSFNCSSTICSLSVPADSTGAAFGVNANPFYVVINSGSVGITGTPTIANTSFGISGTLPAFASTPTFNCGTGCSGSAGATFGAAFPTTGTAVGMTQGGNLVAFTGVGGALKVDNSAVTQPVSGTVTAAQATAASLNATVVGTGTFAVQAAQSGTWTVQPGNTANTTAWLVTGTGGTFPVTQATAASLNATVVGTGTFAVQAAQSGTWNVTNISGTVSLPTGAATSANQPTNAAIASTTTAQTGTLSMGAVTTAAPTYTTAQTNPLSLTTAGLLRVDASGTAVTVAQSTAASLNATVVGTGTLAVQLTGATNNINNISGTISLPTLAATSTKQSDGTQKTQIVDGSGNVIASTSNNLNVQCANCSGSGVSTADKATFTSGSSLFAGSGGFFQTTATSNPLTTGQQGIVQMTATRAFFVNPRDSSGTEILEATSTNQTSQITQETAINTVLGTQADTAWVSGSGTAIAVLKNIASGIAGSIPAGTNVIGKVGIDQTTVGTTNAVSVSYIGTTAAATGSGAMNGGTQRIALATDSPGIVTLGQTTMSSSVPVAIASNQSVADPCMFQAKTNVSISTASGTTNLVTGVSAKKVYVCSLSIITPTAVSVSLSEGSATLCATSSQAGVIGVATNGTAANGLPLPANGGLTLGNGGGTVAATATAANYLCLFQSGTAQLAGNLTYVQQ